MHSHWPQNFLLQDAANYGKFDAPYRFNAKELDQEPSEASSRTPLKNKTKREQTGNYYYGASSRRDFEHKPRRRSAMLARPSPAFQREYYNPTWSVWLSVDPLSNHPSQVDKSPYAFSWNNPAKLVDPDGRCPECEEQYDSPEIGLIHVSSGGQVYQYLETRDENGNATGAEWTGLGGTLAEIEVGPRADNSGDEAQSGGSVDPAFTGGLAVGGGMVGGLEQSYKYGNHTVNYAQKINGKVRSSAVLTRASQIHAAKMATGLTVVGRGVTGLSIATAGYQFLNSDQSGGDYARLFGSIIITATAAIPFVGPIISIGLGAADAYGAFDDVYNYFDQ